MTYLTFRKRSVVKNDVGETRCSGKVHFDKWFLAAADCLGNDQKLAES